MSSVPRHFRRCTRLLRIRPSTLLHLVDGSFEPNAVRVFAFAKRSRGPRSSGVVATQGPRTRQRTTANRTEHPSVHVHPVPTVMPSFSALLLTSIVVVASMVNSGLALQSPTPTCKAQCPTMDLGNNSPPTSLFTGVDSPPNDILCFYFDGSACIYNKDTVSLYNPLSFQSRLILFDRLIQGAFDGQAGSTNCPSAAPTTCTYNRRRDLKRVAFPPRTSRGQGADPVRIRRFKSKKEEE